MKLNLRAIALAAATGLAAASAPLRADPVEEKNVLTGKATLDSSKGYIYLSGPDRQFGMFMRAPDDTTRAEYEKDRQAAFVKAQKSYQSQLVRWRSDVSIAKQTKAKPPEPPEEPKLETFSIGPVELRDTISFGPMYVYAKGETIGYLNAVKPGNYIWYGPVIMAAEGGASGLCMCMGSVSFEVKAGVVTDLGNFLSAAPLAAQAMDVTTLEVRRRAEAKAAKSGTEPGGSTPPAVAFGLPASLKAWPAVQGEFHASGKMNNYYGVIISRLPPIPGVLAYRRDTVIDARTRTDVPNPPIVTQVKIKK